MTLGFGGFSSARPVLCEFRGKPKARPAGFDYCAIKRNREHYEGVPRRHRVNADSFKSSLEGKMATSKRGLDGRRRDKTGRIERKHGNTNVAALRKEYGESFAKGRRKDLMLKTLLAETGSASLHDYLKHHHK
jgi:hypothetical protein